MTRVELIAAVAKKSGLTQRNIRVALDALEEVTVEALNEGDEVKPINGVIIGRVFKDEREYHNPQTGGKVVVPGRYAPRCRFTDGFKSQIK